MLETLPIHPWFDGHVDMKIAYHELSGVSVDSGIPVTV
jgi:hypothetical protein